MKSAIFFLVLSCGMASGQAADRIEAAKARYILAIEVMEVNPNLSYAINCSADRPNCNTVYEPSVKYIPFASLEDVRTYLSQDRVTFIKLFALSDVPVKVEETTSSTPQPPLVTHKKTFIIHSDSLDPHKASDSKKEVQR